MIPTIISFLLRNWKIVVFGIIMTVLASYVGMLRLEINHYKGKILDLQFQIDQAEIRRKNAEAVAKAKSDEITKQHAESLKKENELIDKINKVVKDNINANEELRRVKLSFNLVQLWNSSKQPNVSVAETKQGNDGKANRTETPAATLDQLFLVSAENDANHLKCVKQVEDWQRFWQEFVKAKEGADAELSRRTN